MILKDDKISIKSLSKPVPGKLHHAHCSAVVCFDDGEIIVAYYHALREAQKDQRIYITRFSDGVWSEPEPIPKTCPIRFDGNPALWIDPFDKEKLYLFHNVGFGWSACWAKYRISKDRGKTWSKPANIYPFISRGIKNPPIRTSEGLIVLPSYVEFKYLRGVFFISEDGKKWKQSGKIDLAKKYRTGDEIKKKGRVVEQPTVIERRDGSLLALCRNGGDNPRYMFKTESYDGGKTWTPAEPYILPNPGGGFHMIRLNSGNLAIIYNHAPSQENNIKWRNPLSVALSEDDGKTWSYRRNIAEWHPEDQKIDGKEKNEDKNAIDPAAYPPEVRAQACTFEYPTMYQSKDGTIHATWSFSYITEINGKKARVMDIQYTFFTEEWIKEKPYFENAWEYRAMDNRI